MIVYRDPHEPHEDSLMYAPQIVLESIDDVLQRRGMPVTERGARGVAATLSRLMTAHAMRQYTGMSWSAICDEIECGRAMASTMDARIGNLYPSDDVRTSFLSDVHEAIIRRVRPAVVPTPK